MSLINKLDSSAIEFAHSLHNNFNFLDYFFSVITNMGDAIFLIAVIIAFLIFKKTRICGINMAVSCFIAFIITAVILKPLIARERPITDYYDYWVAVGSHIETSFSCPSSHATVSFAVYLPIFLYFNKRYSFLAVILASIISFSRVYLMVHYASDVIFGAFVGIIVSFVVYTVMNKKIFITS
ncbi:phosphatase PAP2 family protein [Brachyspira pilosicoli]|uniref:phosphatase PAP2 family protein n=1 Tax=Brachyspira pilosicoli TaxID=52584 RepID=UPI0012F4B21F|nr:phosphatase PAP2 family protein [Brachyspira pilosicoli]MBW5378051.1 phosphatase PAP2 family protein [Brachyspira pilosicoli]WIH85804.1 phosphatase PAP2 family protein [Brachyspira pilosicoli]WIH88064.1 phosphatase PAP2 family protein [Brachyspira pilosicoli]